MQKRKDVVQRRNPVPIQSARVCVSLADATNVISQPSVLTEDCESFIVSYMLGVDMLLQDRLCSQQVYGSFKRILNNVLAARDLLGFIDCCTQMRSVLTTHGYWALDLFKGLNNRWIRGLSKAIDVAVEGSRCSHPSSRFDRLATFLGWLKRLPICIRDQRESEDAYYICDRRLSSIDFNDDNDYLPQLRAIWVEWFGKFTLDHPFRPRHGTGATSDAGKIRHDKWTHLKVDVVAHVLLRGPDLKTLVPKLRLFSGKHSRRVSRVVFVPKQAGKDRTICMEPAFLQYLQQGVSRQLVSFASDRSHPLHNLVDISNQEINRELCSWAYLEDLATIDLSDASDSVSSRLVSYLTRGLPLARYLRATRSTYTSLAGRTSRMDKFAPMGSALCFPIECYVFASVVELAYRLHYGQSGAGRLKGCSVYGDDIIVPQALYQRVVDILSTLGFIVNSSKSFSSGAYFESCGVEYLYGVKINTIKHPRTHLTSPDEISPEDVGMITDLANAFFGQGYFRARRNFLISYNKKVVRCGTQVRPVRSLLQFDSRHIVPIAEQNPQLHWNRYLQCSGTYVERLAARNSRADSDFQQWDSDLPVSSRLTSLSRLHSRKRNEVPRVIDPRWGVKGILCLCKFGFGRLLEPDADIEPVKSTRTGRLHYQIRRYFVSGSEKP